MKTSTKTTKMFSAKHQSFIDCVKLVGRSQFRSTDDRTNACYFQSSDGFIYSTTRNYSILPNNKGVSYEHFIDIANKNKNTYHNIELY